MTNWTLGQMGKTNPKRTQTNPTCRGVASGEAGTNPMLVRHQSGGSEAKLHRLLRSCVKVLLAGCEYLCEDLIGELKDALGYLGEEDAPAVTPDMEAGIDAEDVKYTVETLEQILDRYDTEFQRKVMSALVDRQPQRDDKVEKENRHTTARNRLADVVDGWPTETIQNLGTLLEKAGMVEAGKLLGFNMQAV